jgi:3',5'-cyclic AMP phosphodiesterase CpdA
MTTSFAVAHLTDVHLGPIAGFRPRYWNLKRGLGYLNWVRHRRAAYRRDVLDRIVTDMAAQAPDHIAVTGDLVNIGLPQEHIDALSWLQSLGPPERVSVVPGNHDIYSRIGRDAGTRRWAAYMQSNAETRAFPIPELEFEFPFVRLFGGVAVIGVNSAIPTPPLLAWGRVGWAQLGRMEVFLATLRREDIFRLVLIHHPPLPGQASKFRGLRDVVSVYSSLDQEGAELIIHGHNHHNMVEVRSWYASDALIVGAPSASLGRPYKGEPLARYNLYRIEGENPWTVELIGRGLAEPEGPIVELERRTFTVGHAWRSTWPGRSSGAHEGP